MPVILTMSKFWSPAIRSLVPYTPGEQPKVQNLIKLNTNENPYPPSPGVERVLREFQVERLRLYPDPESTALKQTVARRFQINVSQIFAGNGSDEVLALAFMAFFRQPRPLLFPDITYSFYDVYCNLLNIEHEKIRLRDDFSINLNDYPTENGGVIFANPNAPTGILLSLAEIEAFLQRNTESVVIVDEAYIDFGGESAAGLIGRFPNLLVIQTLSKSGSLAGMRVGYAMGQEELIAGLERVKNSFNSYPLDMLATATAVAALEDDDYFRNTCNKIINTRDTTRTQLEALGFQVLPSAANFLFATHPQQDAAELMAYLRNLGILVRHFKKPGIDQFLRISIGTDDEMQKLLEALAAHPGL